MTVASFRYRVCGVSILADRPVPGLRESATDEAFDLHISMRGAIDVPQSHARDAIWYSSPYRDRGVPLLTIWRRGSSYLLSYGEGTTFLINASGTRVEAWWEPPLTDADAADYLLGSVLAFVLRLRGMVPLHASAVVIGDRAVLFAGSAGAGKSSTAAAFAVLGYPILSDDIVCMGHSQAGVLAYPSHPRVSIWSDAAQQLFAGESLPEHSAVYPKHHVDLVGHGYRFHEGPVPIETIFVLSDRARTDQAVETRRVKPQAALMNLVSHTYGNYLLDASMRAREFDVVARIATRVTVQEIAFGGGLENLVAACRRLAQEMALQSVRR